MINEFSQLFEDVPRCTHTKAHDDDVGDAIPIREAPYRLNQFCMEIDNEKRSTTFDNDLIEPAHGCFIEIWWWKLSFFTDYRKVTSKSKLDADNIPRTDDCIVDFGKAK